MGTSAFAGMRTVVGRRGATCGSYHLLKRTEARMVALTGRLRINRSRWVEAQGYESAFWQRLGERIEEGATPQLGWYKWRATRLKSLLSSSPTPAAVRGRVLEIGSGPIGIVNFLEVGERYAIDPLEGFYRQQASLVKLRDPGATYLEGSGEHLPFENGSVSLVIIDNVIDHTYAPDKILEEISRVLDAAGRMYLVVNVHTAWGALLHRLLAVLRIDRGHPYTFTSTTLRRFLAQHRFRIVLEEIEDYEQARQADRRSPRITDLIKGYTGLSEFQHLVLCSKCA
jgi:ubiquinone/menaquinone biosynthesis C-methylase UbiE